MMSLWDALRMNMMISYQELVRTFLRAIFDQAIKSNDQTSLTINALKGHLNYLQSFKKYGFSFEETKYSLIIEKLTKK